jgi:enamine deaminase RidA (YjgF/YER057c/UK114 family)
MAIPGTSPRTAGRRLISSGGAGEQAIGCSRAVRVGSMVFVAGTTAASSDGPVGGDDAGEQAAETLRRIAAALDQAGADLTDVVRTRIFLSNMADFDNVGRVHGLVFAGIRPVTTAVEVAALADPGLLVEMDADAVVTDRGGE